jgi:hypothetical protein
MKCDLKCHVVLFLNLKEYPQWAISAKLQQLSSWIDQEKPFGDKAKVIIIPSDENKVSFLKTSEDVEDTIRQEYQEDPDKFLLNIKNQLEDCLTVHLQLENSGD